MATFFFPPPGIVTFCGSPLAAPGDPVPADVAVLGVPWDGGVGLRPGARHGPRALREASQRVPLWTDGRPTGYWDIGTQSPRLTGVQVVDVGDVAIVRSAPEQTAQAITETARAARRTGHLLVTLGGDHSVTYPVVRAFDDCAGLGLIQFDAHLDFSDPAHGARLTSSTPMRLIAELPFIGPMAAVGLRGLRTDPAAFAAASARGNVLITREALREDGVPAALDRLPALQQVYVTLDIDVLDPSLAPGVSAPEPDGLTYRELRAILTGIAQRYPVVGFDLVETSPPLDPAGLTPTVAVQALIEFLAAVFTRDGAQGDKDRASPAARPKTYCHELGNTRDHPSARGRNCPDPPARPLHAWPGE